MMAVVIDIVYCISSLASVVFFYSSLQERMRERNAEHTLKHTYRRHRWPLRFSRVSYVIRPSNDVIVLLDQYEFPLVLLLSISYTRIQQHL